MPTAEYRFKKDQDLIHVYNPPLTVTVLRGGLPFYDPVLARPYNFLISLSSPNLTQARYLHAK